MASRAPLRAHITVDEMIITDASTNTVIAEIPSTNLNIERISSGMLLTLNLAVDSINLEKGIHNLDLAAGAEA